MFEEQLIIDNDIWAWSLALTRDINDIVTLAQANFEHEVDGIFLTDSDYYAWRLDLACTNQRHNLAAEQIIVARHKITDQLMAYAWCGRGERTPYSQEELAEAKMLHLDMNLSPRQRMKLCAEAISHWQTWATACGCAVLISTSIRSDQRGFMRLHERMGFTLRGSIGYKRLKEQQ